MGRKKTDKQLTFEDARRPDGNHGGWRPGAGRPPGRTTVSHDVREVFPARFPVLVTWRLHDELPSLRQPRYAPIILDGIAAVHTTTFRITDYSIQSNHLHFVQEADGAEALAQGMNSLAGRIVRRLNREMRRSGRLLDDRYHTRVLATPREVKNALRYVINNHRRHAAAIHRFFHPEWIDPYSSAATFDGWRHPVATDVNVRRITASPRTWLRSIGWRRWGLLDFDEIPGSE